MKKLLAVLTSISTIGSIMPMILANAPTKTENNNNLQANNLESNKIETLFKNDYLEFNNKYIEEINEINIGAKQLIADKYNNIYFITNYDVYVLKNGDKIAIKIDGIKLTINDIKAYKVKQILFDNIYVGTENGLYVLKQGEEIASKINYKFSLSEDLSDISERVNKIVFDKNNNVYFATDAGVYFLKNNAKTAIKINGINWHVSFIIIDSSDNLYIEQYNNIYKWKNNEEAVTKIIDKTEIIKKTNINF